MSDGNRWRMTDDGWRSAGVQILEIELFLKAVSNSCNRPGDFAGHKGFSADGRFMVEENTVAGKKVVGFAIVHGEPVNG
jgi:hypothetical protein